VNDLPKVSLDSAAAKFESRIFSRKSDALTTVPPNHTLEGNCQLICSAIYVSRSSRWTTVCLSGSRLGFEY